MSQSQGLLGFPLSPLDVLAMAWFVGVFIGYQNLSRIAWFERRSIAGAVQRHRVAVDAQHGGAREPHVGFAC